jgi:RimJ/RimL family protein N-acetyltransferase
LLIRRLTSSDLERYREIRLEALRIAPQAFGSDYEESKNRTLEQISHFITDEPDHFMLGAYEERKLIGIVSLTRCAGIKMRHKAEVNQMYVTPDARGQGVSRQMMHTLIEMAKQLPGLEALNLTVVVPNIEAGALYDSLGFIGYGLEPRSSKIGDDYFDETLMQLQL